MFAIEEGNSISKKWLELNSKIAVISIVNLAFNFSIGLMLSFQRMNSHVNKVLFICYSVHIIMPFWLISIKIMTNDRKS